MTPQEIINRISAKRFSLENEKTLQSEIAFHMKPFGLEREYRLDSNNIVDFFHEGIAIEVKIKGRPMDIYKQCERYLSFESVKCLILVTNKSMGFPKEINGKPVYVLNLGTAWL